MSKIIVPLHFAKLTNTPDSVAIGFKKFYLKGEWFKLYNGASEIDVVLDRPLDNYVPKIGTITSSDTVLTAIEKLDYAIGNINPNVLWGSITGNILLQTDLIAYIAALPTSTLQQVTNAGNVTTFDIYANSFYTNTGYALMDDGTAIVDNVQFGSSLSYIYYNGTGLNVWQLPNQTGTIALTSDIPSYTIPTLQQVTTAGAITADSITVAGIYSGNLYSDGYNFGISDNYDTNYNLLYQPFVGLEITNTSDHVYIYQDASIGFQNFAGGYGNLRSDLVTGSWSWQLPDASGTLALTSNIPTVGTWGALNYPTWVSGTPFVKMTAAGTFALDTTTYYPYPTGTISQYIRGDGTLATFPSVTIPTLQQVTTAGNTTTNDIKIGTGSGGTGTYFLLQPNGFENYFTGGYNLSTPTSFQTRRENISSSSIFSLLSVQENSISSGSYNLTDSSQISVFPTQVSIGVQDNPLTGQYGINVYKNKINFTALIGSLGKSINLLLDYTAVNSNIYFPASGGTLALLSDIPAGGVTSVTATSPITSSGGATPDISTSMNTNKLIGRSTAGVGVMEEITIGTGLTLTGGTLNASATGGIPHATASGTDTYTATVTGVTAYNDADSYLIRFTNGNTTGATLNINGLGAVPLYRNNDGPLLGGDVLDGGEMLCIYNSTLNEFQVIGISPNSLIAYITNDDSVTITKGQAVYAFSGTGDRMTVKLANNVGDLTSAQTMGLVLSTSIGPNQKGFIITQGLLDGLNILPTATFTDGDPIYLGSTAGSITNVKPYAPNHLVYLGIVTTASNGSSGRMYVKVQNGYELDELHNVQAQTPSLNDTLWYDNTVSPAQWKTASIATILGYTPQPASTRRNANNSTNNNINYCGVAAGTGVSESATVWTIKRLTIGASGSITIATATNVAWTNRESATYI